MSEENQEATKPTTDRVELTTPNGTIIILKGYASGGDMEDMQRVIMDNIIFNVDPITGEVDKSAQHVSSSVFADKTKKALELLVISVNGVTDDVAKLVRDLPVPDYDIVIEKINEITGPLVAPKSTT